MNYPLLTFAYFSIRFLITFFNSSNFLLPFIVFFQHDFEFILSLSMYLSIISIEFGRKKKVNNNDQPTILDQLGVHFQERLYEVGLCTSVSLVETSIGVEEVPWNLIQILNQLPSSLVIWDTLFSLFF